VVLLDIAMPGLDGYEVGRRIKESRRQKSPFVVAVSGFAEDPARRAEAGIDLYLIKPVDPEELRRVLGRFGWLVELSESLPLGAAHRASATAARRAAGGPERRPLSRTRKRNAGRAAFRLKPGPRRSRKQQQPQPPCSPPPLTCGTTDVHRVCRQPEGNAPPG